MFTRGRPVLSPRTVRFLYQLGYICSGTAFGLATLCLEEQRRRIQILQRIADNAKVIRQHPRYRGHVALAFEAGDGLESGGVEGGWMPEMLARRRRRRQGSHGEANEGAVESPTLPSVVEGEYTEVVGGDQDRPSRRTAMRPLQQTSWSLDQRSPAESQMPSDTSQPAQKLLPAPISITSASHDGGLQDAGSSTLAHRPDSMSYRTLRKTRYATSTSSGESVFGSKLAPPKTSTGAAEKSSEEGHDSTILSTSPGHGESISYFEPDYNTSDVSILDIPSEDLSHDIDLFLESVRSDLSKDPQPANVAISNKLFRLALSIGSLDEIRSLCQWKLSTHSFTDMDARYLGNSCGKLGDRLDQQELSEYFVVIFKSNEVMQLNSQVRVELALKVLGSYSEWSLNLGPSPLRHAVLHDCMHAVEDDVVAEVLEAICKNFISNGEASAAAKLFLLVVESRTHQLLFAALFDEIFNAAIAGGHLPECAALLRWKATRVTHHAPMPLINSFIQACGEWKMYDVLVDVFGEKKGFGRAMRTIRVNALSPSNKAILSIAVSMDATLQRFFELLYRDLPESMRSTVDETSAILALKTTWKATRNLDAVDAQIPKVTERLKERADENALHKLDEAVLEIYVSAGKLDRALATIARMHRTAGASNVAICQTALLFAKRASWESFARLVELMKKSKTFGFDEDAPRVFNDVIRVYCQHHSAEEVWDFVVTAIQDVGFTPTRSTSEIVLQSFVTKRRLDLIPKWIEFLTASGRSADINAQMAASLLRRYYIDHRPSHVFMMRLCRKLTLHSPSLVSEKLIHLVEQAIGYDLRHLSGQNASWQQAHAETRLERLKSSKRFVPSPGLVWNEQLYFHDFATDHPLTDQSIEPALMAQPMLGPDEAEDVIEESEDSLEPSLDIRTAFETLRSAAEDDDLPHYHFENEYDLSERGRKKLEGDMWLQMSVGEYPRVLKLYHENLDAVGIPASPVILEIAVEASLRLHNGDRADADGIISRAREAGMNTTCATGPLIIHQLKQFDPKNKIDVGNLRRTIMEYYRSNDENGWRVMHHLGLFAAHTLLVHRYSNQGLDLLSSIYTSKWAKGRPLDICAMTIFLKGYIATQSLTGIRWVVQTVLEQDIRITKKFMRQLRFLVKGNFKWMDKQPREAHPLLKSWVQLCKERQTKQMAEICKLGWELVQHIAKSTKEGSHIDVDAPVWLEDGTLAEDNTNAGEKKDAEFVDESYYSDEAIDESGESHHRAEIRRWVVDDWNAEKEFGRRMKAAALAQKAMDKGRHSVQQESKSEESAHERNIEGVFQASESWLSDRAGDEETSFKPFA